MSRRRREGGCCRALRLHEDNTRFLLLGIVMLGYMAGGAALFQWLEEEQEVKDRSKYWDVYRKFMAKYNDTVDMEDIEMLLWEYGNASAAGIIHKRARWDYSGAFYFVGTVVSTIACVEQPSLIEFTTINVKLSMLAILNLIQKTKKLLGQASGQTCLRGELASSLNGDRILEIDGKGISTVYHCISTVGVAIRELIFESPDYVEI